MQGLQAREVLLKEIPTCRLDRRQAQLDLQESHGLSREKRYAPSLDLS